MFPPSTNIKISEFNGFALELQTYLSITDSRSFNTDHHHFRDIYDLSTNVELSGDWRYLESENKRKQTPDSKIIFCQPWISHAVDH